ncbi:endospore germination permease [Petroclostridium sp. X23]|uniref:GerAB/ArcD/ProY family transporter n=1 Tax=Petroclostridium sp. X23 TaxID=3045146 RepID=UPI0024AE06FC|nr:endospore germination permease [Petroclostridium sp. X23]WHH58587.1 endospore germination permease [Petroclostridium sp. X23]
MIRQSDGKIGTREFFTIILFSIAIKITNSTPAILYMLSGCAAWMTPLLAGILFIFPIMALLSLLKRHQDMGLIEIVYKVLGRPIGFVVNMTLFMITLTATVLNSRDHIEIIRTLFFTKTPTAILYALLIGFSYLLANYGLEAIGRASWFIFPLSFLALVAISIMAIREVDVAYLYPFWGNGIGGVLECTAKHGSILGDIIILTAIFPYVRTYEDFKWSALVGFAVSILSLSIFLIMFALVFGYPAVNHVIFPFQQISTMVRAGRFLENLESFYFGFWIVASVVRFSIYLYMTAFVFSRTIRLKESEPLLLPFAALVIILGLIPRNIIDGIFKLRDNVLLTGSFPIFLGLPLILWLISRFRRGKSR